MGMRTKSWLKNLLGPTQAVPPVKTSPAVTIRYAAPEDGSALAGLAGLDSSRPPRGVVLIAEVGGEPWAAVSLDDHHAVADPFRPSGELVWLLMERARQVRRAQWGDMQPLPRVWPVETRRAALS
jgi:hypothetical protein